jgi:hypothetical protein
MAGFCWVLAPRNRHQCLVCGACRAQSIVGCPIGWGTGGWLACWSGTLGRLAAAAAGFACPCKAHRHTVGGWVCVSLKMGWQVNVRGTPVAAAVSSVCPCKAQTGTCTCKGMRGVTLHQCVCHMLSQHQKPWHASRQLPSTVTAHFQFWWTAPSSVGLSKYLTSV